MIRLTKKILKILNKRQRMQALFIGVMMLIGGILESFSISLILPLITSIMEKESWDNTKYTKVLCNILQIHDQRTYIRELLIILISFFLIKDVYLFMQYYVQSSFIANSRYGLQKKMMSAFIHKPYTYFMMSSTGEIIRILSGDINQSFGILGLLFEFYTELVTCIVMGIVAILISPGISMGTIVILMVEMLVISKFIKPLNKRDGEVNRREAAMMNKWILQSVHGIKGIKVSGTENFFECQYNKHASRVAEIQRRQQTIDNLPRLLIESFTISGVLFILFILVSANRDLFKLIPQISAFAVAAVRLLPSANRISSAINKYPFLEGGLDNTIEVLEEESLNGVFLEEDYRLPSKKRKFTDIIELKNISYSFPESDVIVLNNVNMQIYAGQSIGIVGQSGAGKTTLVDVILGLLKPVEGIVTADGIDIEKNMSSWLRCLAYVPQQIFLMDGSIRENVAFGLDEEEIDDTQVWEALEDAQMDLFVKSLPNSLETEVGEQGIRLSGGQRQRIGIARALYNKPDILIFDEATSALDNETEKAIMDSINNLKGKKTLIIIAHRLSTIENCDIIYRVQSGKLIKER